MENIKLLVSILSLILLAGCNRPSENKTSVIKRDGTITIDPFIDTLQQRSFLYFWESTNPQNGLTPDRAPTQTFSSIAAIGFGLTSYTIGVERQYISRQQAVERVLTTLRFLWHAPQGTDPTKTTGYKGFFYHFLDNQNGLRFKQVELSTIDTALLIAGVLSCQSYFDQDTPSENQIRSYADSLYRRIDWQWFMPRAPLLSMGWHPEKGFLSVDWKGYNEGMLLYILALGSPTHPIETESWQAWTKDYVWGDFHGYEHVNFSPLFGHQYSHIWIDFRGIQDEYMREKGIDYFENSRRATYANRAYCIANPKQFQAYDSLTWGLTACDGPAYDTMMVGNRKLIFVEYWARGASLLEINDDGTIAPTAVGGSIPFAPEICIPALVHMRKRYGDRLFGKYGFYDAFNPTYTIKDNGGWVDKDYLGIDNGPIVLMIENYRNGFVWELMKKNPYIIQGLNKAGFKGGWLDKN